MTSEIGIAALNYGLKNFINVKDFGAVGDGVADDTLAIQAALDQARTSKESVFLPAGTYKITEPLWAAAGPDDSSGYFTGHMFGEGPAYGSATSATIIDASSITDSFAISIQFARGYILEGMLIQGGNTDPEFIDSTNAGAPTITQSDYIDATYRSNQYSPYSGIVIDPTTGSVPVGGDEYSGFTYHASNNGSASVIIRNVKIRNFVVGVMSGPTDGSQGDRVDFQNVGVFYCDVGLAFGQSQNRANTVTGGNFAHLRIAFSGLSYGYQNGSAPIFRDNQIGFVYQVFAFKNARGNPLKVSGLHCEGPMCIGIYGIGSSSSSDSVAFDGCRFQLALTNWDKRPAPITFESHAPTKFTNCTFNERYDWNSAIGTEKPVWNFAGSEGSSFDFDTCVFYGGDFANDLPLYIGWQVDFSGACSFTNCTVISGPSASYKNYRLNDYVPRHAIVDTSSPFAGGINLYYLQRDAKFLEYRGERYQFVPGGINAAKATEYSLAAVSSSPRYTEGTGTEDGTVSFSTSVQDFLLPNDVLYYKVSSMIGSSTTYQLPLLFINTVTTNGANDDIVCHLLCDVDFSGSDLFDLPSAKLIRTNWALHPTVQVTGDFTSGSPIVTNTDTTNLVAGMPLDSALSHIAAYARILTIDSGTQFTMTHNAAGNATGGEVANGRWEAF